MKGDHESERVLDSEKHRGCADAAMQAIQPRSVALFTIAYYWWLAAADVSPVNVLFIYFK